jgi:signal transduction histidine kinase
MNRNIKSYFDKNLYDLFDELITISSPNGEIVHCNKAMLIFMNCSKIDIVNKKEHKLFVSQTSKKMRKAHEKILWDKKFVTYEEYVPSFKNEHKFFLIKKKLLTVGKEKMVLTIRQDISEFKKSFLIYEDYKRILKLIAQDEDITVILHEIVHLIETKHPEMICSILLLDKSGKRLFNAAAPSLPKSFDALNGICIGEDAISCARSAYFKERIIEEDISHLAAWKFMDTAAMQSCWSQPIVSSTEEVLGTFCIYYKSIKKANSFDVYLLEDIASICGIAIEKYKRAFQEEKSLEKQKKDEELLMHKSKQAMMAEMLENIAHQWRQPLSIISTSATGIQLKRELDIQDEVFEKDALENISENAQQLSLTIEDFRSYFKSDSKNSTFDIKECYGHTLKLLSGRLKNEKIHLIEDIQNVTLNTLRNELIQVWMNLFNNSMDEMMNLSFENRLIYVKVYSYSNEVIIQMIDSAGGVNEEIMNRIFEPYFTTKHQNHGTGMGLYMCKEIIEKQMNGTMEARNNSFEYDNQRFNGLEFVISIPIL